MQKIICSISISKTKFEQFHSHRQTIELIKQRKMADKMVQKSTYFTRRSRIPRNLSRMIYIYPNRKICIFIKLKANSKSKTQILPDKEKKKHTTSTRSNKLDKTIHRARADPNPMPI